MTLSRCKHCGAVAHYAKSVTDPHLCWSIQCSDCGIATPSYSQQEMAAAAWNRTAYTHRNGETTIPTVPGQYWFNGTVVGLAYATLTYIIVDSDGALLAWYEHADHCWFQHILSFAGQWWGPVQAPWEQSQ